MLLALKMNKKLITKCKMDKIHIYEKITNRMNEIAAIHIYVSKCCIELLLIVLSRFLKKQTF